MEPALIATMVGIGVNTASALMQVYTTFRRSNVEQYFKGLMETGQDLTSIGDREDLQRYLFSIVDKVAHEANINKINSLKNATVHLATDFKDFDYNDNLLSTLNDLTVFDLTILHEIYSTDYNKEHFEEEVINFFVRRDVPKDIILQSIKRISSHNLVDEQVDRTAVFGGGEPVLGPMYYKKNELGPIFIRFISDNFG
jgi:hypothetical protein